MKTKKPRKSSKNLKFSEKIMLKAMSSENYKPGDLNGDYFGHHLMKQLELRKMIEWIDGNPYLNQFGVKVADTL